MRIFLLITLLGLSEAKADEIVKCGSVWQSQACDQKAAIIAEDTHDPRLERQLQQISRLSSRATSVLGEVPACLDQARSVCAQADSIKLCQAMVLKAEALLNQQIERHNRQRLAALKLALEQQKVLQRDRKLKLDEQRLLASRRSRQR